MTQLEPYLLFNGNCEEAFRFYGECLGGKIVFIQRFGDAPVPSKPEQKDKIMHLTFQLDETRIMGSDCQEGEPARKGDAIHLSLNYSDLELEKRQFAALSEGGIVKMPLQDTFWGAHFGMLVDRFGVHWMFNCDRKKP